MPNNTIMQTDYEFPIVTTKELIKKQYKDILISKRDMLVLDLGYSIDIFEYFPPTKYIEENYVKSTTEYLLLQVSNAYKWVYDDVLYNLLKDYADQIRKKSLGGIIHFDMYKNYIISAIKNKDTIEVETNKKLRFLTNPYYVYKEGEYLIRGQLKKELINRALSEEKKQVNFKKICDFISDYNLDLKSITKKIIAQKTGLSYATVKSYIKNNKEF